MTENGDIIILDGPYEVHPTAGEKWAVVNSDSGNVYSDALSRDEAIVLAVELNASTMTTGCNKDLVAKALLQRLDNLEAAWLAAEERESDEAEALNDERFGVLGEVSVTTRFVIQLNAEWAGCDARITGECDEYLDGSIDVLDAQLEVLRDGVWVSAGSSRSLEYYVKLAL